MSCRARRVFSIDATAIEALARSGPYLELARTGRRDDFAWLAQSQGVPADKIEELWRAVRATIAPAPGSAP
jgi:hypothetical protein